MEIAPIPHNEAARQASLSRMQIVATPTEPELDRITRITHRVFGTRYASITLLDGERQLFKSRINLNMSETPRDISFCGHAILCDTPLIVPDATLDPRFCDNPLVTGAPFIRFYAGRPIRNRDGFKIGTLCVIDDKPRDFDNNDIQALNDLAGWVETELLLRNVEARHQELLLDFDQANRERMIDPLTGLWNRRGLEELLAREIAAALAHKRPAAVFILDIDHFKKVNDTYGHLVGDDVIREIASLVRNNLRANDIVGRFGGEEYVCILPGLPLEQTVYLGCKICEAVAQMRHIRIEGVPLQITISIGATWISEKTDTQCVPDDILRIADDALYEAKSGGRNTVRYKALNAFGTLDPVSVPTRTGS